MKRMMVILVLCIVLSSIIVTAQSPESSSVWSNLLEFWSDVFSSNLITGKAYTVIKQKEIIFPTTKKEFTCQERCYQRGLTSDEPDKMKEILERLNKVAICKSGANIDLGITISFEDGCSCYPKTKAIIIVDDEHISCMTDCGKIPCGSNTTCNKGNQTITASCDWVGWVQKGVGVTPSIHKNVINATNIPNLPQ